jgi:glutamyl-tRNA(Gln) amidotransferase subunit D
MIDYDSLEGDIVDIRTEKGTYLGKMMPRHILGRDDVILIKLDNGYNIGFSQDDIVSIRIIEKAEKREKAKREIKKGKGPKIALFGTGGTIASYVDYRTGAVHPAISSEDFLFSVPELADIADIDAKILFSVLSEDMTPEHWKKMAIEAGRALNSGYEGVVIAHGTDTMLYSSSALSFALRNLNGPVVFVGSQRSSDRPSSDATMNLLSAVRLATSDLGEVAVVMHASTSDDYCHIHRGTRARKMHTSRRDAFKSINSEPIGRATPDVYELHDYRKKSDGDVEIHPDFERDVALICAYPGLNARNLEYALSNSKGAVIAGTGLGHINSGLIEVLKDAINDGKPIVMTSQCLYGTVNMNVYSTGRSLLAAGIIPGGDMLPEVAYVKLSWALANLDNEEIPEFMGRNIAGEIGERRFL